MKFGKIKNLVGAIAPTLGAALGGPIGGSAGKILAEVLGCDPDPKSIEIGLREASPETLAKIKKAELDFEARMKELDVDLFALQTADIQDARSYFAGDWTSRALAILTVTGFLGYIFAITFLPADDNPAEIVNLILGWLGGTVSAVVSYYFGASANKD